MFDFFLEQPQPVLPVELSAHGIPHHPEPIQTTHSMQAQVTLPPLL